MKFEARDIDKTKLPTNHQVIEFLLYLKKAGTASVKKNKKLTCYIQVAIKVVTELWKITKIPIVGNTSIRKLLINLINKRDEIIRKHSVYLQTEWKTLFRISQCKCRIELNKKCSCPNIKKISPNTKKFFIDQCGPRVLSLCSINYDGKNVDSIDDVSNPPKSTYASEYVPCSSEEEFFQDECDERPQKLPQLKVSDVSLKNFVLALDRTNTSDRYGSLLATSIIKDLKSSIATKAREEFCDISEKVLSYLDSLIIDKNKIQRERAIFRAEAQATYNNDATLKCISYDGKKDKTIKKYTLNNQVRFSTITEEHITIVKEPDSVFVGYATPVNGTGAEIQNAIANFLNAAGYSLDHLVAIGCDGTAVNTGFKTGVNACMERYLQRPLQWNVCLLHFNELPLKTLMTNIYGKQVGPGVWPGEFGPEILACEQYQVASDFQPIAMGPMPDNIENWKIRSDQLYLYHMVVAVNNGTCDERLATQKPGPVSTARWLTTASRLLRLYVSQSFPTEDLRNLVTFVVKVYAPFWFLVKSQPQCIYGSQHLFKYILWIRELPNNIQMIIRPTIENNSYYFHPENILLAMVTDLDKRVRFRAYEIIRTVRSDPPASIREFRVPKHHINFDCDTYTEAINWDNVQITEPPCLHFYTDEQLVLYQYSSDNIIKIPEFPCHSQNTERFVRVVNESTSHVTDDKRLGYIISKIKSRQQHSKLDSRQDLL